MDFLKSHLFTCFLISILYFIVCSILYKLNKKEKTEDNINKKLSKDSLIIFIISYLTLIFKDQIFSLDIVKKTQVFTNEPNF